jgi:hypothetical protein
MNKSATSITCYIYLKNIDFSAYCYEVVSKQAVKNMAWMCEVSLWYYKTDFDISKQMAFPAPRFAQIQHCQSCLNTISAVIQQLQMVAAIVRCKICLLFKTICKLRNTKKVLPKFIPGGCIWRNWFLDLYCPISESCWTYYWDQMTQTCQ